jgi:hypothetical protein
LCTAKGNAIALIRSREILTRKRRDEVIPLEHSEVIDGLLPSVWKYKTVPDANYASLCASHNDELLEDLMEFLK